MASPTVDRRFGLVGNVAIKAPVAAVATGNVTLSGQQTIDGVALLAVNSIGIADRVLCVGQTDPTQNGIYDVNLNAWTRSVDGDGPYDFAKGSMVFVTAGTSNNGTAWYLTTSGPITVGTTALTWQIGVGVNLLTAVQAAQAYAALAGISEAQAAAIVLGNFLQSGASAVSRTFTSKARDFVCINDFLPQTELAAIRARTSVFDCHDAIMAAVNSISVGPINVNYFMGPGIYFPPGRYTVNSTLELKQSVRLYGDGEGYTFQPTAELLFPAGVTGITVNRYNTLNGTTQGVPTTAADASIIDGLRITSVGGGATAHGIWLRARALIRNCYVQGFSGNGIHVSATAGGGGASEGNANNFRIEGGACYANTGHGIFTSGGDVNAGLVQSVDCSNNGGWGIYDSSFLGNTYVGCHTAANVTGPYKADNANARNVFLGCYSEGGQPASSILAPSVAIGGLHAAGLTGPWISSNTGQLAISAFSGVTGDGLGGYVLGGPAAGVTNTQIMGLTRSGASPWGLKSAVGRVYWDWNNIGPGNNAEFLDFYDKTAATIANGYARDVASMANVMAFAAAPVGLPIGYLDIGMRARISGAATPSTGAWLQGDMIWNTAPSSGTPAAWMCTVAGTPGTWRAIALVTTST